MHRWMPFPYDSAPFRHDRTALKALWPRLHQGDAEPLPADDAVLDAWALFHAGDFEAAFRAGLRAGGDGVTVANKAQCIQANYLAADEQTRFEMLLEAAERAADQQRSQPGNANAYYWQAYALGRYAQGISVAKAVAQGVGARVKAALEAAIKLQPLHADAHVALGTFHAEIIDKLGKLMGRTQGADIDIGLTMYRRGLRLSPEAALLKVEFANGLLMLEGEARLADAERLYAEACTTEPLDAKEYLDMEIARSELEGG